MPCLKKSKKAVFQKIAFQKAVSQKAAFQMPCLKKLCFEKPCFRGRDFKSRVSKAVFQKPCQKPRYKNRDSKKPCSKKAAIRKSRDSKKPCFKNPRFKSRVYGSVKNALQMPRVTNPHQKPGNAASKCRVKYPGHGREFYG